MVDFKVAKDLYVPLDNVDFYVSYISRSVINDVKKRKQDGRVVDYTCGKKTNSVLYLKTGMTLLLNTTVETLNARRMEVEK